MASLASFLSSLSPIFGRSVAALYERQRALVRMEVLPKASGRGRISGGATATPNTVAWLVVSLLATDRLSEVASATKNLAGAMMDEDYSAPFSPDVSFVEAVEHILADPAVAERITSLEVMRGSPVSSIGWTAFDNSSNEQANFFTTEREWIVPGIVVRALVTSEAVQSVAKLLSELEDDE